MKFPMQLAWWDDRDGDRPGSSEGVHCHTVNQTRAAGYNLNFLLDDGYVLRAPFTTNIVNGPFVWPRC